MAWEEHFWERVDKISSPHGCWLWVGAKGEIRDTYGYFNHNGIKKPDRLAWLLLRGLIPKGQQLLHNCPGGDNKRCINPDHQWLGTHQQNMADAKKKGQFPSGDRNGSHTHPGTHEGERNQNCKLTADDVRQIRKLYWDGAIQADLARRFAVSRLTISFIVRRKIWKSVA